MVFVLRRAGLTIAGVGRASIAEVIDAHLETVSMFFLTTCWAIAYGWVEGTVKIGELLVRSSIPWFGRFSAYHFVLGLTVFAISFCFGFLKGTRMLYYRKRYMLFAALGNYPYAIVAQDFSYFFFAPPESRLIATSWTCQGLGLGCLELKNPWVNDLPVVVPWWYLVALALSAAFFFLAYRSALVNLLVTREVMKETGLLEKVRIPEVARVAREKLVALGSAPASLAVAPSQIQVQETKTEQRVTEIVDIEREELIRRLRERLERGT